MSKHEILVYRLENTIDHPNSDNLKIFKVNGYQVIFNKNDFKLGDLVVHIEPDYIVKNDEQFSFLNGHTRIRVRRLRGIYSEGLLIKALPDMKLGDDVIERLGIVRYEPPMELSSGGENEGGPSLIAPVYDMENYKKYNYIITSNDKVSISEKLHGCLQTQERIALPDGSFKRISEIYKDNSIKEVLGVDPITNKVTSSKILNRFKNGRTKEWLKIKFSRHSAGRGSFYGAITCTPNHKIFVVNKKKFVPAKKLKKNDVLSLIRSEIEITPIQEQILIGKLLGDGSFGSITNESASLIFGHKIDHEKYVSWTEKALGDICGNRQKNIISGYGSEMARSRTTSLPYIKNLMKQWVKNNIKIVPDYIIGKLTPISLAFWYMDDGSLGHGNDGSEDKANFSVCGFTKKDCKILIKALKKFDIDSIYYRAGGYSRLRLNAREAEKLFLLIAPYIPKVMQYKLPERYRGHDGWMPKDDNSKFRKFCIEQKVIKIEKIGENKERWDLETETHNFFANGVLVHNSNSRFVFHKGRMWCGSHRNWKKQSDKNLWWKALLLNNWLESWCIHHEDHILYSECIGQVQDLKYGFGKNELKIAVFDIMYNGKWANCSEFKKLSIGLYCVPLLYEGIFDEKLAKDLAEGDSSIPGANNLREGVVIKTQEEIFHPKIGRIILKLVSDRYLGS